MKSPTLSELPPPPKGKTGWPWTKESPKMPDKMSDGTSWPRISIVTPSFNQGLFIEETIRSVLLQGYPNLEYIIIDGGSSDSSMDIIRKYENWISFYISEKDRGQAHAINKGLEKASGVISAYLNSDDIYMFGTLWHVGRAYEKTKFDVFVGMRKIHYQPRFFLLRRSWWKIHLRPFIAPFFPDGQEYELPQECIFWNWNKYKTWRFDEDYVFCLDRWWFLNIFSNAKIVYSSRRVGDFRIHPHAKSSRMEHVFNKEMEKIRSYMNLYEYKFSQEEKKKIMILFVRAARVATFFRLFPWKDRFFQYVSPNFCKNPPFKEYS